MLWRSVKRADRSRAREHVTESFCFPGFPHRRGIRHQTPSRGLMTLIPLAAVFGALHLIPLDTTETGYPGFLLLSNTYAPSPVSSPA